MPDDNKFKKLREVGYRIPQLCCYCKHGNFGPSGWGTCGVHRYDHKKHDNPEGGRGISIHVTGSCRDGFEVKNANVVGAYQEFFDGGPGAADSP